MVVVRDKAGVTTPLPNVSNASCQIGERDSRDKIALVRDERDR